MYRNDDAVLAVSNVTDADVMLPSGEPEPVRVAPVEIAAAVAANDVGLTLPEFVLKRIFDLVSVLVILALFGWLMIIIATVIRFSGGKSIIFGHTRVGRGGKTFQCYKFRSMVSNSQEVLRHLLETDPVAREQWDRDFKLKDDPRVTRIGRFIRKTSLDELPQLWNVVTGDMSIVGPRPVVQAEFDAYYENAREHYLSVPPGLTGLWQVSGRNDLDYEQRVELDKAYVDNWNVFSDFIIVMRTVKVMVVRRGAY